MARLHRNGNWDVRHCKGSCQLLWSHRTISFLGRVVGSYLLWLFHTFRTSLHVWCWLAMALTPALSLLDFISKIKSLSVPIYELSFIVVQIVNSQEKVRCKPLRKAWPQLQIWGRSCTRIGMPCNHISMMENEVGFLRREYGWQGNDWRANWNLGFSFWSPSKQLGRRLRICINIYSNFIFRS